MSTASQITPTYAIPNYRGAQPFRTMLALYSQSWFKYVLATLLYGIKHSPVWAMPLATGYVIDLLTNQPPDAINRLWQIGGVLLLIQLQNSPVNMLYTWLLSQAIRDMELRLRAAVSERLQLLSLTYFTRRSSGTLQTKIMRDVEMVEQVTRQFFDNGLAAFWTIVSAVVATSWRAPRFLLFYALCIPLAVLIIRALRQPLSEHNGTFRQALENLAGRVNEMTQLIPITRAHGQEQQQLTRLQPSLWQVRQTGLQLDIFNGVYGSMAWVAFQFFSALCLFVAAAGYLLHIWQISVGDIVLLTSYFGYITSSVLLLTNLMPQLSKGMESIRSLGDILEATDLEDNAAKPAIDTVQGAFHLQNLQYAYPDNQHTAITGLTAEVAAGQTVAIVGASGSGKSTLLNLLLGLVRPQSGQVLLDGVDLNSRDLRTYRQFVAVVPQEPVLFAGSIRENVLAGNPTASQAELQAALQAANASEFVNALPDGLDTVVGERGASLSGGQKQRLAIARAIIRNPRVLVLDEATSAVDNISEQAIQQALVTITRQRTTFIVAHRLSTIRNADVIWVLAQGKLVEVGDHQTLLARGGRYAQMIQTTTTQQSPDA
jgi:ATP-binding cassette subfamily B protein